MTTSNGAGYGGAILNLNGSLNLTNSTVAGNFASSTAGGLFVAAQGAAGTAVATATLRNTIVSGSSGTTVDVAIYQDMGTMASLDVSISNIITSDIVKVSGTPTVTGSPNQMDPNLGPLMGNGGPTPTKSLGQKMFGY